MKLRRRGFRYYTCPQQVEPEQDIPRDYRPRLDSDVRAPITEDMLPPLRPTDVDEHLSWFDRLSTAIADTVARAWFFCACVLIVIIWAPSYFLFGNVDTWQLIINTFTTIVTFLLVALLQNTQSRDSRAYHRKLNAIADGLADLMQSNATDDNNLAADLAELRAAVGLEHREGSEGS